MSTDVFFTSISLLVREDSMVTREQLSGGGRHAPHSDSRHKTELTKITDAIADAAAEVTSAARGLEDSIIHFQKAREKGSAAIDPVRRAGKKAVTAVRKTLPGKR